jgi:hypothetical protein
MKKPLVSAFLIILLPVTLFSQKIFREGYIIKNSGEKIEGLVEYYTGKRAPSTCVFKRFDIAMEVRYTADDIKAFGYKNGSRFDSALEENKRSFWQTVKVTEPANKNSASGYLRTDVVKSSFGVIAGLNVYSLKIKPEAKFYLPDPDSEKSFYIGASFERLLSWRNEKLSVYAEAAYLRQTFYSYSTTLNSFDRPIEEDAFFDFSAIKLPVMLRYSFGGLRFTPYVNAGLSGAFFIDRRYLHIKEEMRYEGYIVINEDNDLVLSSYELAAVAGIGTKLRISDKIRLNCEGRIEFGNGVFDNDRLNRKFGENSIQTTFVIGVNF